VFIDASAVIAIIALEPEHSSFGAKIEAAPHVILSPLTLYESTLALTRLSNAGFSETRNTLRRFLEMSRARIVAIDGDVGDAAIDAFQRFGKGRHRAALNMGDCFSYACAKVHGVALLFTGDDFVHTDITVA
jgi:ribonuclease VapC